MDWTLGSIRLSNKGNTFIFKSEFVLRIFLESSRQIKAQFLLYRLSDCVWNLLRASEEEGNSGSFNFLTIIISGFQLLIHTTTVFAFKTDEDTKVWGRDKAEESGNGARMGRSLKYESYTVPYTLANYFSYYCLLQSITNIAVRLYLCHTWAFLSHDWSTVPFWGQQSI